MCLYYMPDFANYFTFIVVPRYVHISKLSFFEDFLLLSNNLPALFKDRMLGHFTWTHIAIAGHNDLSELRIFMLHSTELFVNPSIYSNQSIVSGFFLRSLLIELHKYLKQYIFFFFRNKCLFGFRQTSCCVSSCSTRRYALHC